MARSNDRDRSTRRAPKDNGRRQKKKVCIFCRDGINFVDYKDVNLLRKFMSDRGKIRARRVSGNCAQHQRAVARAIKSTRELALLPYLQRTASERPGGRGGRGGRGGGPGRFAERSAPDVVASTPQAAAVDEVAVDVELTTAAVTDEETVGAEEAAG